MSVGGLGFLVLGLGEIRSQALGEWVESTKT